MSTNHTLAYFKYFDLCTGLGTLLEPEFQMLIDPMRPIMQVLLAHYVAVLILIYPIKAMEWDGRNMGKPNRATVFRLDSMLRNIPGKMHRLLDWPLKVTSPLDYGL